MNLPWRLAAAALIAVCLALPARAQDVTLTSRDGKVEVVGTLVGFDGEFYRVESEFGILTVDGSAVICSGPGCPILEEFVAEIRFSGTPAIGEALLPSLIEAFAAQEGYRTERIQASDEEFVYALTEEDSGRPAARFAIHLTTSAEGFADLVSNEADVVMSLREVLPDEIALASEAGLGLLDAPGQNRVIALDAVVPVVSHRNPLLEIALEDLAAVIDGETGNWSALDGIDAPIVVHVPQSNAGVLGVFLEKVNLPEGLGVSPRALRHKSNADLVEAVGADPFAIGLAPLSDTGNTRALSLVGGCGFTATATPDALKSEDYPLTAPLFLYLPRTRLPAVGREFIRFTQTPAAQIAVLRAGFVDQGIARTPLARQGERLANAIRNAGDEVSLSDLKDMLDGLDRARRLSVTFRFDGGSARLDAQSRSNLALLARVLETGTLGADELTFVGFSDGEGAAEANRRLSRERAVAVRDAVLREAVTADFARVRLRVAGYGEAMPMACDDTAWGREVNRRVELWAR